MSTHGDKRPIRMITLTGEALDVDNLPKDEFKKCYSRSTYIRNRNMLISSDILQSTHVCMYNLKDKCVTKSVLKGERIKDPKCVVCIPGDSVLVCSADINARVQVSATGRVLGSHKLDMPYPSTV